MSGMSKRIAAGALCLTLVATAGSASRIPGSPWQRAEVFATCSGLLAALGTRQRAEHDPAWTHTLRQREMFDLLLEATLPAAVHYGVPQDEPKRWRSTGWVQAATLLADIAYAFDDGRATRAAAALEVRVADCTGLLLGS